MKIVWQNALLILSFVAYQYFCLSHHSTIGVLRTENYSQIKVPLDYLLDKKNAEYGYFRDDKNNPKSRYEAINELVSKYDSFEASKTLCNMMQNPKGLAAVFGVDSLTSAILQSTCDHFEIPYFITSWRPPTTKVYKTVLNFFPEAKLFAQALSEVVKSLQWNNFVIIYETEEGLIRMQEILKLQTFESTGGKKTNILVKQLGTGADHRSLLKEIKVLTEINIILDCSTENILPILKQAMDVGVLYLGSNVFLTSLDAHTLDYSSLKTTANITTIRLFDNNNPTITNVMKLNKNEIKTETILFHDALLLLTDTVNALLNTNDLTMSPIDCNGPDMSRTGYTIVAYMKHKQPPNDTLSGPLIFDTKTGNRIDFNVHLVEIQDDREIAVWYSNNTLVLTRDFAEASDAAVSNLQKTTVIVASNFLEPYLMERKEEGEILTGNNRYQGYSMDLITEIAKIVNFKFEFHVGNYGPSKLDPKKKKWTGLIGEILERRAHLAISDLTVTHQRREVVDFSMPYMTLGIGILHRKPAKEEVNMFAFLDPFSITVWIYTATLYLIISVVLYFIARMTPGDWENPHPCDEHPEELENTWDISNCMWLTLGSIMTQGSDILTKGISSRICVSMWWFFSLIMVNSYMANLTAFLTKNRMEPTIESAEQLAKQSKVKYGTVDGGATQAFFRDTNYSTYKRMWEMMDSASPSVFEKTNPNGVTRVQNTPRQLYAFLMESTQIEYEIETKCDLRKVGNLLDRKHYGIAMPMNAPYRTAINKAILQLSEKGKLEELKKKWWKDKRTEPSCDNTPIENSDAMDLANVGGIFLVLGIGAALAVVLGLAEFLWNIRNICVEEHITYWEALKVEVKFACCIWKSKKKVKPVTSGSSASGSHKDERIDNKSLVHSIMHSAGSFMNLNN
ncbi:hypothetical protein NQ318_007078 [Aromia moschata]|uniref:Glutamate receptor ionotropic, kainate 2-like n=1 Tax=Aromia moschata TaxID=1265417 RepID=A0AAV8XE55_9CUCU|nr:hypothetical protein NQ318_007078 [Aromia moschata]